MAIILTNDFPPAHGGIQRYMVRLADEFVGAGEDVLVIAPVTPGAAVHDAGRPYRVSRYANNTKIGNVVGMLSSLVRVVARNRSPIVASLWYPAGLAALLVPRPLRGKLAVLVHGAEIQPSRGGVRRELMRFVLARADVVVANSRYTKSLVEAAGIDRPIVVINCGVDANGAAPEPSPTPTVLAVGRLVRRKGFDRLITALAEVARSVPDVRCEIVGDGPERATLQAHANELGVAERVLFAGAVDDEELERAYRRAWCFCLPVRNDGEDVEGFGIVYLEAAMASLPTVGGERSGAEDAIADGETGLLVDGNDPKAIAAALIELLQNPERSRAMGARGRQRALAEFSWTVIARRVMAALA